MIKGTIVNNTRASFKPNKKPMTIAPANVTNEEITTGKRVNT